MKRKVGLENNFHNEIAWNYSAFRHDRDDHDDKHHFGHEGKLKT